MKIITHGYLAVDLFFILSGFVIYLNYQNKITENFPKSIIPFYWNRFTRIYPLHFSMLIAYLFFAASFLIFSKSASAPTSYNIQSFVQNLFLVHAWGYGNMSWNIPSWSISAEWFVYLLFPFLALILKAYLKTILQHLTLGFALLFAIYFAYSLTATRSLGDAVITMALSRTIFEFLLGNIIASLYLHQLAFLTRIKYLLLVIFIVASILYVNFNINDYVLMPLLFFTLIIYLCIDDGILKKILSHRTLVYLGEISYATYIVHYLIFDLLKAGWVSSNSSINQAYIYLSFFIVFIFSAFTHHILEIPAQKYLRTKYKKNITHSTKFQERI